MYRADARRSAGGSGLAKVLLLFWASRGCLENGDGVSACAQHWRSSLGRVVLKKMWDEMEKKPGVVGGNGEDARTQMEIASCCLGR